MCVSRCVRGVSERALSLTLRQVVALLLVLAVLSATLVMQYFEYLRILPEKEALYGEMKKLNDDCELIKKTHPTAYMSIEDKCSDAKLVIRVKPGWSAIGQLVNTTWPHAENVSGWASNLVSLIFSSVSSCLYFTAAAIFFWPTIQQKLGLVGDEYNRRKDAKVDVEMEKLLKTHLLASLMPNSLAALVPARKRTPHVTHLVVDETRDDEDKG
jgi:hypothetical protein